MTGTLQGRRIAVTRPRAQAVALAASIAAHGGEPVVFPLLVVSPADDREPLRQAIAQLDEYALAVFVSPNAIAFTVPGILAEREWPDGLRALVIGPSSVAALARHRIGPAIAPRERFDSEAVLELPELQGNAIAGKRVAIFRGNGGRELLAETLRARGARVDCIACYQRSTPPDAGLLAESLCAGTLDALTISSSEGLRNLVGLLDEAALGALQRTAVFVPHQRIADLAQELGVQQVILTGAGDAGLCAALLAHAWRR